MIKDFISLVFPEYCFGCETSLVGSEKHLCISCLANLPKTDFHRQKENLLAKKFWGKIPINNAFAFLYFSKKGIVQNMLFSLKYEGAKELGSKLGLEYAQYLKRESFIPQADLVLSVPLHQKKLKKRGYNQAGVFASAFAEELSINYSEEIIKRKKETETQTKKGRLDRWKNVDNIFEIINTEAVKGKKILIMDDVVTTGSTIEACGAALLEAGAAEISIGAIAVA
jgi:ComF family protein